MNMEHQAYISDQGKYWEVYDIVLCCLRSVGGNWLIHQAKCCWTWKCSSSGSPQLLLQIQYQDIFCVSWIYSIIVSYRFVTDHFLQYLFFFVCDWLFMFWRLITSSNIRPHSPLWCHHLFCARGGLVVFKTLFSILLSVISLMLILADYLKTLHAN